VRRRIAWVTLVAVAVCAAATASAGATTLLRLDGIGPLKLGMTRSAATHTGWLSDEGKGCPLGGPPIPVTYQFTGSLAPRGIEGSAQFDHGKLTNLSFSKGVRTANGVQVGSLLTRMASAYRSDGFKVRSHYLDTFGGTFVDVSKGRRQVIGAFGTHRRVEAIALRAVPVCE
jgi:hypothetical protein